jgi:hypothetical protein
VPQSNKVGTSEPQRAYSLFSNTQTESQSTTKPGFYIGGNIYSDWASVPDSYKEINSQQPDPRRSSGTIFKFTF